MTTLLMCDSSEKNIRGGDLPYMLTPLWVLSIPFPPGYRMHLTNLSLQRFSYDLEMKAREQNRNEKRTEIERFGWFIERTDKRAWLFIG